jgi:hypothetical protein
VGGRTRGSVSRISRISFPLKLFLARMKDIPVPTSTTNTVAAMATCRESLKENKTDSSMALGSLFYGSALLTLSTAKTLRTTILLHFVGRLFHGIKLR